MTSSAYRSGLLWLLGMGLMLWFVVWRLQITSDLTLFMPQESGSQEKQVVTLLREGVASRVLLIALSGADDSSLAEASRALATSLGRNPLFLQVSNGSAVIGEAERARWFRYRYLLSPATDTQIFTPTGLRQALQSRLEELSSPLAALTKPLMPLDPVAAFPALLQQWQPSTPLQYRQGVWFSADGGSALLLALTAAGGFDLDRQEQSVAAVHHAVGALPQAKQLQLTMSGPGVIGVLTRDTIRSESQWLGAIATVAVTLLLWLAYRSLPVLLLSAIPMLSALLVGVASTLAVFGSVHGITLAFGMTLLGVAIDYPLHLFSHLQQRVSAQQTLLRIWQTLRLGVLTTAFGYLAMVFSDFGGLKQLAVFAISGLLTAAAVVRWVLPALLGESRVENNVFAKSSQRLESPYARRGMLSAVVLALTYLLVSPQPLWQSELAALSPIPAELRVRDTELRRQLGAADLNHIILVRGDNVEHVLQRCEALRPSLQRLRDDGVIGSFLLPSDLLPSTALQHRRQQMLPSADELTRRLTEAGQEMPFRSGLFEPFIAAVAESITLPALTVEDITGTSLALRLQPMLRHDDGGWLGLVQLGSVSSASRLLQWAELQPAEVSYLDINAITTQMVTRFRNEALIYLLGGFVLIVFLLRIGLRGWKNVLPVLLPVAAALTLTLALLHGMGVALSLFNLVALLLVLGVGIDYGLFFARREHAAERSRTEHALTLCAISTVSVFGILAFSHIPVLRAIGLTVALGVTLAYLLARWGRAPALPG